MVSCASSITTDAAMMEISARLCSALLSMDMTDVLCACDPSDCGVTRSRVSA